MKFYEMISKYTRQLKAETKAACAAFQLLHHGPNSNDYYQDSSRCHKVLTPFNMHDIIIASLWPMGNHLSDRLLVLQHSIALYNCHLAHLQFKAWKDPCL
jgi:hypothetical protein